MLSKCLSPLPCREIDDLLLFNDAKAQLLRRKLVTNPSIKPFRSGAAGYADHPASLLPLMSLPLIGITTSELRSADEHKARPQGDPPRRELALGLTYPQAVAKAGAIPVVIPPLAFDRVEPLVDRLCGLVLSGGPDLDPATYGAQPHPDLGPTEPEVDVFELDLARGADARGLPILGLCRGAQALNVARGGTLVQDVRSELGTDVEHRQPVIGPKTSHAVRIEPGSRLADALGRTETAVNSFHHQAVERLGRRLEPVAWAPDGVVEAIEASDRAFAVGVQWHAESLVDAREQLALFEAFVAASLSFEQAGRRRHAA